MNMVWNRASPFICEQWRRFCNGNSQSVTLFSLYFIETLHWGKEKQEKQITPVKKNAECIGVEP